MVRELWFGVGSPSYYLTIGTLFGQKLLFYENLQKRENVHLRKKGVWTMAFNARVKKYGNGTVQVRYYSKPIITKVDYSQSETELEYLKKQYQETKMDEYLRSYTLDPFTQNWVHFLEEPKEEEEKERCSRSQKRSKQKIYEHTRSCHWQWFITLTLNPRKVDSLDYD